MSEKTERWVHAGSFNLILPQVLTYSRESFGITFYLNSGGWASLSASVPAPSPTEGWRIKSLMLRYHVWTPFSEFGFTGKLGYIGVWDAERYIGGANMDAGPTSNIKVFKQDLPETLNTHYHYGLSVGINAGYFPLVWGAPYTRFSIYSAGIEFLR